MNEGKYTLEELKKWADIVIEKWEKKIEKFRIKRTDALLKSLEYQAYIDSSGDPEKVHFTFLYYGRFIDSGVGRGVKYKDVPTSNRTPKPWYSKTFIVECRKLASIMAQRESENAAKYFRIIENNTRIKL